MKCRHCLTEFAEEQVEERATIGNDKDGSYLIFSYQCPSKKCEKYNHYFLHVAEKGVRFVGPKGYYAEEGRHGSFGKADSGSVRGVIGIPITVVPIRPLGSGRDPIPPEVDDQTIAEDYTEACLVLQHSAKASAALSRRCLEQILENKLGIDAKLNLHDKIEQAKAKLPDYIANDLHVVREIGNFGAHSRKSTNTGEVLAVEPGEAEWNLDVIEELFEFLWVAPKRKEAERKKLNDKLVEAGKKPV